MKSYFNPAALRTARILSSTGISSRSMRSYYALKAGSFIQLLRISLYVCMFDLIGRLELSRRMKLNTKCINHFYNCAKLWVALAREAVSYTHLID